jgi:hypothetical protein
MGLSAAGGYSWFPTLDTASHPLVAKKDLTAWVVGIDSDKLMCVLCKVRNCGWGEVGGAGTQLVISVQHAIGRGRPFVPVMTSLPREMMPRALLPSCWVFLVA